MYHAYYWSNASSYTTHSRALSPLPLCSFIGRGRESAFIRSLQVHGAISGIDFRSSLSAPPPLLLLIDYKWISIGCIVRQRAILLRLALRNIIGRIILMAIVIVSTLRASACPGPTPLVQLHEILLVLMLLTVVGALTVLLMRMLVLLELAVPHVLLIDNAGHLPQHRADLVPLAIVIDLILLPVVLRTRLEDRLHVEVLLLILILVKVLRLLQLLTQQVQSLLLRQLLERPDRLIMPLTITNLRQHLLLMRKKLLSQRQLLQ